MSRPADPSASSFLVTLPPEVRNAVYEVLFKRDRPVLLHNDDAYYPRQLERACYVDNEAYNVDLKSYRADIEIDIQQGHEFKHDFGAGIQMLLSCLQVYYECVGVLYGSNSFVVSRALHRHDFSDDDRDWTSDCNDDYNQFNYAPKWLFSIGSQVQFLRQVLIDVTATCPSECAMFHPRIEIMPYLLLLWSEPELEKKVKFFRTDRRLKVHSGEGRVQDTSLRHIQNAEILNNIVRSIGTQDILQLKRYRSFGLLAKVWVEERADQNPQVCVSFGTTTPPDEYDTSNNGTAVYLSASLTQKHQLLQLPLWLLRRVCEYVVHSPSGVTYDLDERTVRGLNLSMLQLNSISRKKLCLDIARTNSITLIASTCETETSFGDFSALRSLCTVNPRRDHFESAVSLGLRAPRKRSTFLQLKLYFKIPKNTTLKELSIDIQGLMDLILMQPRMAIQILLTCTDNGETYSEVLDLDMEKLRMNPFLTVVDMMKQRSNSFHDGVICSFHNVRLNGEGLLKGVTYSGIAGTTVSYDNYYSNYTKEEMMYLGHCFAAEYRNIRYTNSKEYGILAHWGQVHDFCVALCDAYWA